MSADDRTQVRKVITQYVEAYLQADVASLRDVFASDAVSQRSAALRSMRSETSISLAMRQQLLFARQALES